MTTKHAARGAKAALRKRAEADLAGRAPPGKAPLTAEEAAAVIHELEVHQIELELQAEELREAQEELLASRALYFSLYDLAPVAYLTLDEKGFVAGANLTAATLLGEGPATLQGRHFSRWVVAEDQDLLHLRSRQLLQTGQPQAWEMRLKKRDGTPLWARLDATRAESAAGGWTLRLAATDVSERREAEAARRRSEQKFEATFRASRDAIAISELESRRIVELNEAFSTLTGLTRQELLGRRASDIELLEAGSLGPFLAQLRAEHHLQGINFEVRSRTGERRTTVGSFDLIQLEGVPHVVSTLRDVTRELELRRQLEEVRQLESVGRLAGGIAHDFNNALAIILLAGGELRGTPPPGAEAVRDLAGEILDAADRAGELTRQLLAFARRQLIAPVRLDLDAALLRAGPLLRRVLGEAIELEVRGGAQAAPILCDPGQLEQVLLKLALNARDAMPRGGRLTLATAPLPAESPEARAYPDLPAGDHVQLTVSDTGAGMPPEVLARVFEPFFTTKELGHGAGLGLSAVHGIVKQSGGAIRCESTPGQGTTFFLGFPRTGTPVPEAEAAPASTASPVPRPGGAGTVLLVEDDPVVRRVTARALEAAGFKVHAVDGGPAALELAAREPGALDLLVTDVVMPGLDGAGLARQLRQLHPRLPVLFVSGYSHDVLGERGRGGLDAGTEFLHKPFTGPQLLEKARLLLGGR